MKQFGFLLAAFLLSIGMKAQTSGSLSVNLYGGYTFSDRVEFYYTHANVEDGLQYGAGLEYFLSKYGSIELKYLRMDTQLPYYGSLGKQINIGDDNGALSYVLFGGTSYFETGSSVMPYLGGSLGVGIVETDSNGNDTNFGWEIRGGMKIKTGSSLSVNVEAHLQSMSAAIGDSYYYTYYGVVGVTDYASTYQFGLGVVLSYNFSTR